MGRRHQRGVVTRASARTTPVAGSRCTGMYRPQSASPTASQPPAHGASVVSSSRPASGPPAKTNDHSSTSIRRERPASPLGGAQRLEDSTGVPATSADGPAVGPSAGAARRPRPTRNRLSAPRSPAAAAPPIPPVPSSFTPAKGHGQSSRNGDVSDPTTAKPRGDLHEHGDGPAGRATPSATLGATSSATDRRNPQRNLVLLVARGVRSRGSDGSVGAGEVAQLGACRRHRGDGFPVGVPPQPYGQA